MKDYKLDWGFLEPEGQTLEALQKSIASVGALNVLHPRDRVFLDKVMRAAKVDPEVIEVVLNMRMKLNEGKKLTNDEASELIEVYKCQGFYRTDLNLSGYVFKELNLNSAIVGGDANFEAVVVERDCLQEGMWIRGNYNIKNMVVAGKFTKAYDPEADVATIEDQPEIYELPSEASLADD